MEILKLHHAQISIPKGSEKIAREFYCQFLGLKEVTKPDSLTGRGGFWLELGEIQIHVGTEDGIDRAATKSHLAYQVTVLQKWRQKLMDLKVVVQEGIPIPGFDRFEFRDPFGNRVEFLERK